MDQFRNKIGKCPGNYREMKILAFDLSTTRGSLAWLSDDVDSSAVPGASFECEWPNDRQNSATFFENLHHVSRKFGPPETIIVGLGPGSYAGTRIAISAAIGLQVSSGARLVGFPSICAMNGAEYCVIGDARRKSFFFAHVRANELVEGPNLFNEAELNDKLDKVEPGMSIYCSESLPQFSRSLICYPSALVLARLAQDAQRSFSFAPLEPIYLREPHITMPKVASSR